MSPREPLIIGEFTFQTPEGPVVILMAVVRQRRETVDMHGNRVIHQVVACPYCGGDHEHADWPGFHGPNCGYRGPDKREYFVMPTPLRPVPRGTPYPGKKRGRGRPRQAA